MSRSIMSRGGLENTEVAGDWRVVGLLMYHAVRSTRHEQWRSTLLYCADLVFLVL